MVWQNKVDRILNVMVQMKFLHTKKQRRLDEKFNTVTMICNSTPLIVLFVTILVLSGYTSSKGSQRGAQNG